MAPYLINIDRLCFKILTITRLSPPFIAQTAFPTYHDGRRRNSNIDWLFVTWECLFFFREMFRNVHFLSSALKTWWLKDLVKIVKDLNDY